MRQKYEVFLISIASIPAVEPIRSPVKGITGGKDADVCADRSLPWSAKTKNTWSCMPTALCVLTAWQLCFDTRRHISDDSIR